MADMLSPLLWLSPAARDVLRSTSKLLKGSVPCALPKFAQILKDGDAANQCEGVLGDARIRAALSKRLTDPPKASPASPKASPKKKGSPKASPKSGPAADPPAVVSVPADISDATAASLVENLGAVLSEQLDDVKARAAAIAKDLPDVQKALTIKELAAALPKGVELGDAAKRDVVLWSSIGRAWDAKVLPQLAAGVLKERFSILVACAQPGAVTDCAVAMHVLQNIESYVAWELSFPGSQPAPAQGGVVTPFDKKASREVAMRRVLSNILPMEVAADAAEAVASGGSIRPILEKLTTSARTGVVIPFYTAPPAPAEPKEPKEKKEKPAKGSEDKKAAAAAPAATDQKEKPKSASAAASAVPAGGLTTFHGATATQELQWHLLRYRMTPQTTLSKAVIPTQAGKAAAPGSPKQQRSAAPASAKTTGSQQKPAGFAGHTPYSWDRASLGGKTAAKSSTKAAAGGSPKAKAKAEPAGKAAAAPAKAAAPSADGPADGTPEAALLKLDFRCGQIKSCEPVPDSEQLYLLQVDIGDENPRQVITGLQKFYKVTDLVNRLVFVYCNIKPGKLAGYESQAMVMAGTLGEKGTPSEKCQLLDPPAGAKPGDRPSCGSLEVGSLSAGVSVKNISKQWGAVKPLMLTNDKKQAAFSGTVVTIGGKPVTIKDLCGAQIS